MKIVRFWICLIFLTLMPAVDSLASGVGTTAAQFLKIGMGARAVGMGKAFSAVADDSNAVFWNPAGLAGFDGNELNMGFVKYFQDVNAGNLAYSTSLGERRFGIGAIYLSVPGIEKRGLDDNAGLVPKLGTFNASDLAVSLAYAVKDSFSSLIDNLDTGFALKFIKSSIDTESAVALALDAGALYHATDKINVALVVQNIGSSMKFKEEGDPLPLNLKVAMAYRPNKKLTIVAGLSEYFIDEKFYASAGGEYWLRNAFAFRGGYSFGYDTSNLGGAAGLSAGFGMKVAGIGIDYAFLPFGDLGNTHRFGFWIQF